MSKLTCEQKASVRLKLYIALQFPNYVFSRHHLRIIDALERVERGEIKRLVITMPPRHGKSMIISEFFPAWYLGRNPNKSIITSSYGAELAEDFGRKVRNQILGQEWQAVFPNAHIDPSSKSSSRFNLTEGGAYYAVGVGGATTGRGANCLLIDDPVKDREQAESETIRRKIKDWYRSVAYTRLMENGAIIIVMTRWHEDDLVGWCLSEQSHEQWQVLSLPAMAEEGDLLGRKVGEPLWPERFSLDELDNIKLTLGSRAWNALYQQRPVPEEGNIFKKDWVKYYLPKDLPQKFDKVVLSWDMTFKEGDSNDFVVGQAWGRHGADFYLLDQVRARMGFTDTLAAFRKMADKWPEAREKLVEDKANGPAVIDSLKHDISGIIPIEPDGSKTARAHAVTPMFEAGNVYLPHPECASWIGDYVSELVSFPTAAHDDQVDATTQAIRRLEVKRGLNINPKIVSKGPKMPIVKPFMRMAM